MRFCIFFLIFLIFYKGKMIEWFRYMRFPGDGDVKEIRNAVWLGIYFNC